MNGAILAVANSAAGGGRCGRQLDAALLRLQSGGVAVELVRTERPGHAVELARRGYGDGYRRFLAIGGDGTAHEVVNGLFPEGLEDRPALGFMPLGTGNSFLRDFDPSARDPLEALRSDRRHACDVLRLRHADGVLYYINLLSLGFAADVAALTNRRFKGLGPAGYLLGVLVCLLRCRRQRFPLRADGDPDWDSRPCLFLTFNNSKYTGGTMLIAPQADTADGLIEFVRFGPIGRWGLLRNLRRLYDGTHVDHPLASRRGVRRVDFDLDGPVDVMVDGEVRRLRCQALDVLPQALDVCV